MSPLAPKDESTILRETVTSTGSTLADLSLGKPMPLVLLRHSGCTFFRKAMAGIALLRSRIERESTQILLGHMGTAEEFQTFAMRYGSQDLPTIANPERTLYRGLGLKRGNLWQRMGIRV
jgi:hypothetical protein